MVNIPNKNANHNVEVIPKSQVSATDTYGLKAQLAGQTIDLANNIQISNIQTQSNRLMVAIAPSVTIDKASNTGSNNACLNDNLTSLGSASSAKVSFEWGTESNACVAETAI